MGLKLQKTDPTRLDSTMDIVATGSGVSNTEAKTYRSKSDHALILCTFQLNKSRISDMKLKLPNKKAAEKISLKALNESNDTLSFLTSVLEDMSKRDFNIMKEINIKPKKNVLTERILSIENEDEDV